MCYTMKSANVTCRKLLFLLSTLFFNYPILICIFCHNLPISKAFFVSHNGNEERTDTHIVGYLKVFLEHPSPTLGLEENQVLSKKKSLDFDNLCLASLKFRHSEFSLDSWNLHSCAANPGKAKKKSENVFSVPLMPNQVSLNLIAVKQDDIDNAPVHVAFWTKLPLIFPNQEPNTVIRLVGTQNMDDSVAVQIRLECIRSRYGPQCSTRCLPPTEHHVCDQVTGKLRCAKGWNGRECDAKVILSRVEASQFLRRFKRANSWHRFEELQQGNIERECQEERCSREEAREAFEDDTLTQEFWTRYTDPNQCQPNPCVSSHTVRCEDKLADYKCHCKTGYQGKDCRQEINACSSSPCYNDGRCRKLFPARFSCDCPVGFRGRRCEINIDDCLNADCGNHGSCQDLVNDYRCVCDRGYTGATCLIDIDECQPNPCENNGNCSDHVGFFSCDCPEEYYGQRCHLRHSPCRTSPCFNGAICVANPDYSFNCSCPTGYTGAHCEHVVGSPCIEEPCLHGGKCFVVRNNVTENLHFRNSTTASNAKLDFRCACSVGYGGKRCQTEIPACEYSRDQCPSNATCVSLQKNFFCVCPEGFAGDNCDKPGNESEVAERYRCEQDPCMNGGRCLSHNNLTVCMCRVGFSGPNCEVEIDYCDSNPCINGAECISFPGKFHCNCAEGYNGIYCESDIDECSENISSEAVCLNNATCNNTFGSFECICGPYHIGRLCEVHIDPCEVTHCQNGATCLRTPTGPKCECIEGYGGNYCDVIIKPCEEITNPCLNNATCTPMLSDPAEANCTCMPGFYGQLCEKEVDHCVVPGNISHVGFQSHLFVQESVARTDCGNHGDCVSERLGFRCECHFGFEGEFCDREFIPPVVNCSTEYCKCPSKLLKKLKSDHNLTNLKCQYRHYDEGVCTPPICVSPFCRKTTEEFYCDWKSKCLDSEKSPEDQDSNNCPLLEMVFDRTKLILDATVNSLCEKVRGIPTMKKYRDSVTVHCDLKGLKETNITTVVAFDSVTSDTNAFLLAIDVFQRLEQEIQKSDEGVAALTEGQSENEIDPFFSETLISVRFGSHKGHFQRHFDKMARATMSYNTNHDSKEPVWIAVPLALVLLLTLILITFFLVQRRRRRKTIQINFVANRESVGDVMESASVDRIVVSPHRARWFKTGKNKKKKLQQNLSFDNPLFAGSASNGSARRLSVRSNDYGATTPPAFPRQTERKETYNSVEKSTVDYLVGEPPYSGTTAKEVSARRTIEYDMKTNGIETPTTKHRYTQAESLYSYSHVNSDPYSFADDMNRDKSSPKVDKQHLVAKESSANPYEQVLMPQNTPMPLDASCLKSDITGPTLEKHPLSFNTVVTNNGEDGQGMPSAVSDFDLVNGEVAVTPTDGDYGRNEANTENRACGATSKTVLENQYHVSRLSSASDKTQLPEKQVFLPEIYSVPRKANPNE